MAKFSYELRELISTFGEDEVKSWFANWNLSDFLSAEEINTVNEKGVWSKEKLLERIITHFYTREIGTDAIGQFIKFAEDKMNEVMETYAPIIYSTCLKYNPLYDVNVTETFKRSTDGSSESSSSSNGSGLTVNSDTPQGQISKNEILKGKYASSTSANESDDKRQDTSSSSGNEASTRNTSGTNRPSSQMIMEFRNAIRAVNTEIIYELEPLFMGLY